MNSDIAALIERVEKASEGGPGIDALVLRAVGFPDAWCTDFSQPELPVKLLPVSTSIDAAVAVIKRVLDCDEWNVGTVGGGGSACIWIGTEDDGTPHSAATPALALCLAALRARQSQEPR